MKPSEYALNDPIAAIATALVSAALAVVRTSGKGSIDLVASRFSRPEALRKAEGNTLIHGWILDAGGNRVDEAMLAVFRAPKSFTGEDAVEITCHGGTATVLAVYRALVSSGFRAAERGEFTFRSFANGRSDLARAEAVREIIEARTDAARARAAARLSGGLSAEIAEIKAMVVTALAAIEVEIEYPEDEETTRGAFDATAIEAAAKRLADLESSWAAERLYRDGARVVLAGKTNAGKSSLFNALLKEDRAIVSETHGTTRDWLESAADFGGIPVRIFDTAGLRETTDAIEAEGVGRSRDLAADSDILLYLVDATVGLTDEDRAFLAPEARGSGQNAAPLILVWNKSDKEGASPAPLGKIEGVGAICPVSAKKGSGISELVASVTGLLLADSAGAARQAGLGTERQKVAVRTSLSFLEHALDAAKRGFPMDAIAQDLEDALAPLGEITGEVSSADILDAVFSGFCVGK